MAQQSINVGSTANDGTGDLIRDGFIKTNTNFSELYTLIASGKLIIDNFSSSGTWTKRDGLTAAYVITIGGGAGGGSGMKGAAGTNRGGGGGGAGGQKSVGYFPASLLGATETVTVGAGGTGGASVSANSTSGNNGGIGGTSSFGAWLTGWPSTQGSGGTSASGGAGGSAGNNGATFQGAGGGAGGGFGAGTAGLFASEAGAGGGGGGGISSANTASAGAAGGGIGSADANIVAAGGAINTAGTSPTARAVGDQRAGIGGGGGGASTTGAAGAGGAGQEPGGGGGGGGAATDSVGNSGAGGNGGNGRVIVFNFLANAMVSSVASTVDINGTPTQPPSGIVRVGDSSLAGLDWPSFRSAQTTERFFNPLLGRTKWLGLNGGGQQGLSFYNIPSGNVIQSGLSGGNPASTSYGARQIRSGFSTSTTAGTTAGFYVTTTTQLLFVGGGGAGGFLASFRFGFGTGGGANTGAPRAFVGLTTSGTTFTNVNPSTLTNVIGIGLVDGSNNLNIIYGGSSAQTSIDLGVNFPGNTSVNTDFYDAIFFSDPNDNTKINYRVDRYNGNLGITNTATGTLSNSNPGVTLPPTSTGMAPTCWISNNTTAAANTISFGSFYAWSE